MSRFWFNSKKWLLLVALVLIFILAIKFKLHTYFNFATFKLYQAQLVAWTHQHYVTVLLIYLLCFTLSIAAAIPVATFLTLLGGLLFGSISFFYAMFATTLGGVILYLAVRSAIGDAIKRRSSGVIKRMEAGFQRNAFNYLLTLRLVPVFPCWFSNVSAGALGVPLNTFVSATILGIAPSTLMYTFVGRGLDKVFQQGQTPSLNLLLTPSLLLPLLGLALLSLVPVLLNLNKANKVHE